MSRPTSELKSFRLDTILKAGAGAGKTTTLVRLFIEFAIDYYRDHGRFPKVVVSTFTRKATQELKERLAKKALEMREDSASDTELKGIVEKLFDYISTKSLVQISTIHGVLGLFLTQYGYSIGLSPDFSISSDADENKSSRKILRDLFVKNEEWRELLEELDFSTIELFVKSFFEHYLTNSSLKRISKKELDLRKKEQWEHLVQKLPKVCREIIDSTENEKWQDFCKALIALPWNSEFEVFKNEFQNEYSLPKTKPPFKKDKPIFDDSLHDELVELREMLKSFLEDGLWDESSLNQYETLSTSLESLAIEYSDRLLQEKLNKSNISMRDLELLSIYVLRQNPTCGENFSKEWDFWMIDEYQDTSPIQVHLLNSLINGKPSFYVGDPQQSIYLFRGARSRVFHEKVNEIKIKSGIALEALDNYRSHKDVLAVINSYFTELSPQFSTMTVPSTKSYPPLVDLPLKVWLLDKDEDQNPAIIHRLQELLKRGVSAEKICVLGRTNRDLEALADMASIYNLPVQLHAGGSFYERREVQDILQIIKVILNPHDNVNFVSVLRSPWFYLSDAEIASFCDRYESSFFSTALAKSAGIEGHPVQEIARYKQEAEAIGINRTLLKILKDKRFFESSYFIDPTGQREANIWKLLTMLSQEERRPGFNFLDFVDEKVGNRDPDVAFEDGDATPVIEPKRINLMTVHASKGLQFEHVLVPWMERRPLPFRSPFFMVDEKSGQWIVKVKNPSTAEWISFEPMLRLIEDRKIDEQLEIERVLYVALTRAISGIHLFWTDSDKVAGWAGEFPFSKAIGVNENNGFKYSVENLKPEPNIVESEVVTLSTLREVYSRDTLGQASETSSITALLEKEMGLAQKGQNRPQSLLHSMKRANDGTEAHRVFESLKYSVNDLASLKLNDNLLEATHFILNCDEVPMRDIISNGFVEWGFALKQGSQLMQGQIDLWGVVNGVLYVVDYKTGSEAYSEVAFKQLEFYSKCLSDMKVCSFEKIELVVVYPLTQKILKRAASLV